MIVAGDIRRVLKGTIRLGEPLARYTSFRIGGAADYFIEPASREDLIGAVRFFRGEGIPLFVLGNGSNVLVSDRGFRGVVINPESGLAGISIDETGAGDSVAVVTAEAGVRLAKLVDFCVQRSLGGMEMLAGIPGTVGGAVFMNAGAFGGTVSDTLVGLEVLRGAEVVRLRNDGAGFSYRASGLEGDLILTATFRLRHADKEDLMRRRRELLIKRNAVQPVNVPNAGSIFKNPPGGFAAALIEQAGMKGRRHGHAVISPRHANFIVNEGNATASDVMALIRSAHRKVKEKFNVSLELEVQLVGFGESPLREVA